jgi:multidrug efflux pump subunit AcrA (membrane-fusion protein)
MQGRRFLHVGMAVALVAGGYGAWRVATPAAAQTQGGVTLVTAKQGPVLSSVNSTGNVAPAISVDMSFRSTVSA